MSVNELPDAWDAKAARLLQTSKAYRSKCNEGIKNGLVGQAAGLMAAAAELRKVLEQSE